MHACVNVCMDVVYDIVGEYSALYISKTNKNRNIKIYTQSQITMQIVFIDFGKNRKKEVGEAEPEMRSEVSITKMALIIFLKLDT